MRTSRMRWLTLALPLGLLAASCGDDDDDGTLLTRSSTDDTTGGHRRRPLPRHDGVAPTRPTGPTRPVAPTRRLRGEQRLRGPRLRRVRPLWHRRLHRQLGQARSRRRAHREVHDVRSGRGVAQQGGVLVIADPAAGVHRLDRRHRGVHRRADRHRPVQARGLGARQPDRAHRQRGLLGHGRPRRRPRCSAGRRKRPSAWSSCSPARSTASTTSAPATSPPCENDSSLQLIERDPLNVFYLGFNVDKEPFDERGAAPGDRLRHRQGAARLELLPCRLAGGDAVPAAGHPAVRRRRRDVHGRSGTGPCAADRGRLSRRARHHPVVPQRRARLPARAGGGGGRHPDPVGSRSASTSRWRSRSRARSSTTPTPAT